MKKILLTLIRIYQLTLHCVQHFIPFYTSCRFYPSCSEYTFQAIEKYGIFKGTFWGVKRIFKCHPFHSGGYAPLC